MDPTSVRAWAPGMQVMSIEYSSLPVNVRNLLDRYVGRELTAILPDPADADARTLRKATLLSNDGAPIFLVGDEVYVGAYDALLLPELPKDLTQSPTLALTTENRAAGSQSVRLSYLMDGLNWRADYALTVDDSGKGASLDAWASLNNQSGYAHAGADLKLVAGDVRQVSPVRPAYKGVRAMAMNAEMDSSAPKVAVAQELSSRFQAGLGQLSMPVKQAVELTLALDNTEKNSLGRPMPAGLVRVFMPGPDKSVLLAGESTIGHVGPGGQVKLGLGRSFDVAVERSQTSFARLGKNSVEMGWQIRVTNGKAVPQAIRLVDGYPGQWKVTTADHQHTSPEAGAVTFDLVVPPSKDGKQTLVNYTVQVTY
jgi:hypothetical protein